jgi:hypothetical protein
LPDSVYHFNTACHFKEDDCSTKGNRLLTEGACLVLIDVTAEGRRIASDALDLVESRFEVVFLIQDQFDLTVGKALEHIFRRFM